MESKSFNPTDVKWIPPAHGFTPRYPNNEADDGGDDDEDEEEYVPTVVDTVVDVEVVAVALDPARRNADDISVVNFVSLLRRFSRWYCGPIREKMRCVTIHGASGTSLKA